MSLEIITGFLLSESMIGIYCTLGGIIVAYIFNNHFDKPKIRAIAYNVIVEAEKNTEEGTIIDTFMDEFIKRVELEKGRKPNAGELKTGVDIANKKINLTFNKNF